MNREERVAYLESLLRRTQEFVGVQTQAEKLMAWGMMPATTSSNLPGPTRSDFLRKEADTLERQDALIVELREVLQPKDSALKQSTAVR